MHVPVLLEETLRLLITDPAGIYLDGTLGRGGHAEAILQTLAPEGRLIGLDCDEEAIQQTAARLQPFDKQLSLRHANFSGMKEECRQIGVNGVTGVLLDLGVSSPQLDTAGRGFSFSQDGPLDMRMDPSRGRTAADWVNGESEERLADILRRFGEERDARRIARAICQERTRQPIERTGRLAAIVERAKGGRRGPRHPATRTFQALRMAVNAELDSLEAGLEAGLSLLRPGGRMAVITFHSLEDRCVKNCFRRHTVRRVSLQQGGEQIRFDPPPVRRLTRRPLTAGPQERQFNPRARSAKLRVAEREIDS